MYPKDKEPYDAWLHNLNVVEFISKIVKEHSPKEIKLIVTVLTIILMFNMQKTKLIHRSLQKYLKTFDFDDLL